MIAVYWIIFVLLALFLIASIGGFAFGIYYTHKMAYHSDRTKTPNPYRGLDNCEGDAALEVFHRLITELIELPTEQVHITSRDGLRLSARYYHTSDGAPTMILCHGFRSCHERDFCGISKIGLAMGHNLLLIDQRSHGKSEGTVITYGIKERFDVIDWISYINERSGTEAPIILYGLSMGAATVLMAAGEPLPDTVRCVVADCPFSSPLDIIVKVSGDMKIPAFLVNPMARIAARIDGFSITETSPVEAVKRAEIPILLIHGEADGFVPCYMSEKIAAANPSITFERFPNADHALCCMTDNPRYNSIAENFIKEALNK